MSSDTYVVSLTFGETLEITADFAQASSQIYLDGQCTPYQVADTCHCRHRAAVMLIGDMGRDYWLDPDAEIGEDEDGETTYDGLTEEEYIDGLIESIESIDETEDDADEEDPSTWR